MRELIQDTVAAGARTGGWRNLRERNGAAAIGAALRRLHQPTTDEPLPPDFVALLGAIDAADRRRRR